MLKRVRARVAGAQEMQEAEHLLNVLASKGLNLTKLESRPRPGAPWEYVFYVDFEGNLKSPDVEAALKELTAHVISLKVLGSYPIRTVRRPAPAPGDRR